MVNFTDNVDYKDINLSNLVFKNIYCPLELRSVQRFLPVFIILPDYWKKSWGRPPILGFVNETSDYWAKYAAYDARLLTYNATFGPKAIMVKKGTQKVYNYKDKKKYDTNNKTRRIG